MMIEKQNAAVTIQCRCVFITQKLSQKYLINQVMS